MSIYPTHKHHIVPRHAGGTDDPSNLVELTVEDHAIAHKILYGLYGRWQDRLAWQALSGRISKEDIIREKQSAANKGKSRSIETKSKMSAAQKGRKITEKHKANLSAALKGREVWNKGKSRSLETKQKISDKLKGNTPWNKGKKHSAETKAKISATLKSKSNKH